MENYTCKVVDWAPILALSELEGNVAPPSALAGAVRFVHDEAHGGEIDLGPMGLDMTRWETSELLATASWISAVLTWHANTSVRSFAAWILRMVLFEMACRVKESAPPKQPPRGPMN